MLILSLDYSQIYNQPTTSLILVHGEEKANEARWVDQEGANKPAHKDEGLEEVFVFIWRSICIYLEKLGVAIQAIFSRFALTRPSNIQ